MNRRAFLASGSTAFLGTMLFGPARSFADAGALSVRATAGGPLITPNGKFFVYSQMRNPTKLPSAIDIDGLVATPARYSLDDLAKVPPVKKLLTLECFINTAGGPLIFTTPFEGAPLSVLFAKAGVKPEAKAARIECSDGHPPFLLPLSELQRPQTMLVAKFGTEAVPLQHGSPYGKLFIPGAGANHHPKWVTRITLVDRAASEHHAPPMAGFLSPSPPETVATMSGVTLTGYAFSGPEPVGKVELSTDNGQTYQSMPLPPQPDPNLWITWDVTWRPPERGFYVLRIKATSAGGRKQDIPGVIAVEVH
jgi:DMSO/TMAO reductase YedYZ molybdopterin-dependent catalytic subunit